MTQLYCSSEMIDSGECEEYFEFVYEMDNEVAIATRRYHKIPALLGKFGGVLKLLTTLFVILSFYYSKAVQTFLFNKVFKIERPTLKQIQKRVSKYSTNLEGEKSKKDYLLNSNKNKEDTSNLQQESSIGAILCHPNKKIKEVIDSRTDVVDLVPMMNLVEILKKACLKKHQKILLPLAILNSKRAENQAMWAPEAAPCCISDYQKKFKKLKQEKAGNSLEGLINLKIVRWLSLVFEEPKQGSERE